MSDRAWTLFVRGWRDLMRQLFMPPCSRSEPCCERECVNVATHFALTGNLPQGMLWRLFARACWNCGAVDPTGCGCDPIYRHVTTSPEQVKGQTR